jgi:hypothetical protein
MSNLTILQPGYPLDRLRKSPVFLYVPVKKEQPRNIHEKYLKEEKVTAQTRKLLDRNHFKPDTLRKPSARIISHLKVF